MKTDMKLKRIRLANTPKVYFDTSLYIKPEYCASAIRLAQEAIGAIAMRQNLGRCVFEDKRNLVVLIYDEKRGRIYVTRKTNVE